MKKYIGGKIFWTIITIIGIVVIIGAIFAGRQNDPSEIVLAKPVIYLYPEEKMEVSVKLNCSGELTASYPAYNDGWTVTAEPDGTLYDHSDGREYSYLFWEGPGDVEFDFSAGFCVPGKDTAAFLQDALARQGLTPREYNEFIVYWMPLMQGNAYNVISFQGKNYTDAAQLSVTPEPDSVLRVFMAWYGTDEPVELAPQEFAPFEREGFTLVEWGGSEVR